MTVPIKVACPFCGWSGFRDRPDLERVHVVACDRCCALVSSEDCEAMARDGDTLRASDWKMEALPKLRSRRFRAAH